MVRLGVETLAEEADGREFGGRIGLITNPSGVTGDLTPTIDLLHASDRYDLEVLFAPQHGLRGNVQGELDRSRSVDERTGLPVRILSDQSEARIRESFADVDVLIYDMQDIGCRFYTLVNTLAIALREAAATGTRLVILDRPNPIAPVAPEGNTVPPFGTPSLDRFDLPITHGLTVGELARYFNVEFDVGGDLEVIGLDGWDRDTWYDETDLPWVHPSPNMPTLQTALLYPGTCFFESTNLSEGRGTTKPFELVGAPWIDGEDWAATLNDYDLSGVAFRPAHFTPMFSKHERKDIEGVQVHILDRDELDPVALGITMLVSTFDSHEESEWLPYNGGYFVDRLAGGSYLRKTIDNSGDGVTPVHLAEGIREYWSDDLAAYMDVYDEYRLY
ncbi:exo-beta-N-acetylmuramidase NamZ family protein [Halorarum halobium]|uniref:exo-beta-N-acetylmuramidase NamZ family protein n=1 Tax=Halorarum halobium TaxID=3075121 RepID=UPI0028AF12BF|nr:DUF1343 domain-containing protein [Halobaculum sp. XH14]